MLITICSETNRITSLETSKTKRRTDLLQVQHSGLHPGHLHLLVHLINVTFDQAHRQSLHHQQLHLQETQTHRASEPAALRQFRFISTEPSINKMLKKLLRDLLCADVTTVSSNQESLLELKPF